MKDIIRNIHRKTEEGIKLHPKDKSASIGLGLVKSSIEMFKESDESDIVKKLQTIVDVYEKKIELNDLEYFKTMIELSKLVNNKTSYK